MAPAPPRPPAPAWGGQTRSVALLLLVCAALSSLDGLSSLAGDLGPLLGGSAAAVASTSRAAAPAASAAAMLQQRSRSRAPAAAAASLEASAAAAAAAFDGRSYFARYELGAAALRRAPGSCWRAPEGSPRVAVVGFMKNEAHVLREWLEHYFWQGVDAVLLLDNDSKDEWREVAREFPRTTSRLAPRRHKQEEQYNQLAVPWLYDMDIAIVIVVDLDEFLFSRDERSLQEVLLEFFGDADAESEAGALFVPWSSFGSSKHVVQPPNVREHFTWRHNDSDARVGGKPDFIDNGKTISRVSMLKSIKIHRSFTEGTTVVAGERFQGESLPQSFSSKEDGKYGPPSDLRRAGPPLQLNHYPVQSLTFFETVKMKRGAADTRDNEFIRTRAYFDKYDFHERQDTALRDLVARARANGGTLNDFKCRRKEEAGAEANLT